MKQLYCRTLICGNISFCNTSRQLLLLTLSHFKRISFDGFYWWQNIDFLEKPGFFVRTFLALSNAGWVGGGAPPLPSPLSVNQESNFLNSLVIQASFYCHIILFWQISIKLNEYLNRGLWDVAILCAKGGNIFSNL